MLTASASSDPCSTSGSSTITSTSSPGSSRPASIRLRHQPRVCSSPTARILAKSISDGGNSLLTLRKAGRKLVHLTSRHQVNPETEVPVLKKLLARFARQSPAMIVALLALFIAMGGTAIAASSALITGKQIKNSSITGADVKNKSLTPKDFRGSVRGPRGLTGATGVKGDKGDKGDKGPAGAPNPNAVDSDKVDGYHANELTRVGNDSGSA